MNGSTTPMTADEERIQKRRKLDEEDEIMRIKDAKETMRIHKEKKAENIKLNKHIRVRPSDRNFLQKLIFEECFNSKYQPFPKDNHWKTIFYRLIDSYTKNDDNRKNLLRIEKEIFLNIKPEIEEFYKETWSGSTQENFDADFKVACSIKHSFKIYEKDNKKTTSFFDFTCD